ncbi:MAG: glycosyltransferase family 2 protein, partial [Patescibacteria group bacterium]
MKLISKGISLVIIAKNEEKNIAKCIQSAKTITNEIIVVDMKSSDLTAKVARANGARVYTIKDYNHVEPARKFAISKAHNEWIILLDADERLTTSLKKQILKLINGDLCDVIIVPRQNIILGKWIKNTGWWPDY